MQVTIRTLEELRILQTQPKGNLGSISADYLAILSQISYAILEVDGSQKDKLQSMNSEVHLLLSQLAQNVDNDDKMLEDAETKIQSLT